MDATYAQLSTDLFVDGDRTVSLRERQVLAGLGWRLSDSWSMHVGAGGIVDGAIGGDALAGGAVASVQATWRALDGGGGRPFVDLTIMFAGAWSSTEGGYLAALDLRGGATVGWLIADAVSPYLAVRAFGGPVLWEHDGVSSTATDWYHHQIAIGASVLIARRLGLYVDWAAFGERAVSAGVSVAL